MASKDSLVTKKDCDVRFSAFMEELKQVRGDIKDISVAIAELPEKLWERADQRYAPKWVADALKVLMSIVAVGVIGALLKQVIVQ